MKEAGMSAISMVDLDRTLSLSVARARHVPLLVTNRHKPWVWLVSHETWRRERQYLEYIPDSHPLVVLRQLLDDYLAGPAAQALQRLAGELNLHIDTQVLCRALCLRAIHAIASYRRLYESIGYNMAYRYFVGMDSSLSLWPYADFDREIRDLAAHPELSSIVAYAVAQYAQLPHAAGEFRNRGPQPATITHALPDDCDCGLTCLPPRLV